jgi:hypothetical protein
MTCRKSCRSLIKPYHPRSPSAPLPPDYWLRTQTVSGSKFIDTTLASPRPIDGPLAADHHHSTAQYKSRYDGTERTTA